MSVLSVLDLAPTIADGPLPALALEPAVAAVDPCEPGYFAEDYEAEAFDEGVTCDFAPSRILTLAATVEDVTAAVRPRGAIQVTLPFRVYVNDVLIDPSRRYVGLTVTEGLKGPSFSFVVPRRADFPTALLEPLGSPEAYYGAPPGKARIDIDAGFVGSGGLTWVRLVTGGVVENSPAAIGRSNTRTINGVGARGRYDKALATLTLSPGHGLARNDVVRRVLEAAGVPASRIAVGVGGRRCYKGVQLVDANALAWCDGYLQPAISELAEERDGRFVVRSKLPKSAAVPVDWTFREVDITAASEITETTAQDGPTCVRKTGTKQILRDSDGLRTVTEVVETWDPNSPPAVAAWRQSSGGTLSAVTDDPPLAFDERGYLVSRVITQLVYQGDTLVLERVTTEGRYNPLVWRYGLATDGSIASYNSGYLMASDAVADDGNLLYRFKWARWGALSQQTTAYVYDARGMQVSRDQRTSRYLLRYRSVQDRLDSSFPWDAESYHAGLRVLGNGDGVMGSEGFAGDFVYPFLVTPTTVPPSGPVAWMTAVGSVFNSYVDRTLTEFDCTDDGYRTRDRSTIYGYSRRPGVTQRYNGGEESSDEHDVRIALSREQVTYIGDGQSTHAIVTEKQDLLRGGAPVTEIAYGAGDRPAAERSLDLIDPAWLQTHSDDDLAYAKAASRFESQPIKSRACAPALGSVRESWEQTGSSEWAEDTDELDAECSYEIRAGCRGEVQFELAAANPLVRPRQMVHLFLPSEGYDATLRVVQVQHVEGQQSNRTVVSAERWFA